MSDVINLNALARPDIKVALGKDENGRDRIWRLPHPDSETVARLTVLLEEFENLTDSVEERTAEGDTSYVGEIEATAAEVREIVESLFAERQTPEELQEMPRLTMEICAALYSGMIAAAVSRQRETDEEAAGDDDAARPTSSTTPKQPSAKRSPAKRQTATARKRQTVKAS
jgi:hypothetical protein